MNSLDGRAGMRTPESLFQGMESEKLGTIGRDAGLE